jgi:N-acetyl-gamma-glutamyl-phosphate reductase
VDLSRLEGTDLVFLALPSGESMALAPRLMAGQAKVIDLSGDFRLPDAGLYKQFYGRDHTAGVLLEMAVYGLPELNRDAIRRARLVANPGCYPTAAILALLPALRNGLIDPASVVINSLSGVSGAGRSASVDLSFSEVNENVRAYKVGNHQHIPEIQLVLEHVAGGPVRLTFIPHLVPITRGIYTTVCADLVRGLATEEVLALYDDSYAGAPFVRVKRRVPEIRAVVNTNYCDIGLTVEARTNRLIIQSVIDNMVKGAAGQAVQNMNLMFGVAEEVSLI